VGWSKILGGANLPQGLLEKWGIYLSLFERRTWGSSRSETISFLFAKDGEERADITTNKEDKREGKQTTMKQGTPPKSTQQKTVRREEN